MARGNSDLIDLFGQIVGETEKAWRFLGNEEESPGWLPKSQVEWDEDGKMMTMPEWLGIEKGLI